MDILWIIYWANVIGKIHEITAALLIMGMLGLGITLVILTIAMIAGDMETENYKKLFSVIWKRSWIGLLLLFMDICVPSSDTMYLMIGSKYLADSKIPEKAATIINMKLDDIVKKMKEANK
jgi:hypothetical protein